MQPHDMISLFIQPLEKNDISYFITGSIAAMSYGEPRLTVDVDVVVHLASDDIAKFSQLFPEEEYYCPPPEVIRIECSRRTHGHFNLIHPESGFKADIYPTSEDPLHHWALKNRRRERLDANTEIWIAPPEYVIIRKLEYFREGDSQKHLEDIRKMLPQVGATLDRTFLDAELGARGLTSLWQKVLEKR